MGQARVQDTRGHQSSGLTGGPPGQQSPRPRLPGLAHLTVPTLCEDSPLCQGRPGEDGGGSQREMCPEVPGGEAGGLQQRHWTGAVQETNLSPLWL